MELLHITAVPGNVTLQCQEEYKELHIGETKHPLHGRMHNTDMPPLQIRIQQSTYI